MSGMYEGAIQDLIDALGRLPGVGPKSAQRIAFHILQSDADIAAALVDAIGQFFAHTSLLLSGGRQN